MEIDGPIFHEVYLSPFPAMPLDPLYKQAMSQIQYAEYRDGDNTSHLQWLRSSISYIISRDYTSLFEFNFLTPSQDRERLFLIRGAMIENVEWATMDPPTFVIQLTGRIFLIKAISPRVTMFWYNLLIESMEDDYQMVQLNGNNGQDQSRRICPPCCSDCGRIAASVVRRFWRLVFRQ